MRKDRRKSALIMSLLSLVLCVSMFISTTFAWFADSVSSAHNKIVAGSLQIDLELLEEDGSWSSVKETGKPVFDYDNWEPGYTEVKILRVVNKGTLSLEWIAKFVAANELSDLADVIDVYVNHNATAYPANRNELSDWEKIGTISEFVNKIGETANGNLKAGDVAYIGIAFKMQETAGNEYQGMDLGSDFDIQIFATQYTYERDSFGSNYDAEVYLPLTQSMYFRSLRRAIGAIAAGTISEGGDCSEQEADVSVNLVNGQYQVTLLNDTTENAPIEVTENVTLVLNGNRITFSNTDIGFLIPQDKPVAFCVDGRVSGSSILISGEAHATAIQVNAGTCTIVGGAYESNTTNAGKENAPNSCIEVNGSASLNISNATVSAFDTNAGTPCGIYAGANCQLTVSNCDILAASPYGLGVHGIHNLGNAELSGSRIKGYSNYTANKAGTAYASNSRGVCNSGDMMLFDCYVIGTHSGVKSEGTLFVDGGTYESYGHGGIYFCGSNTTSYIKNAKIQWCAMPDGYYDDGVAGTNNAGMYIGGGVKENIVVYADNCSFDAPNKPGEGSQSIVVRGSSGEKNDVLYISNCNINTSAKIRVDANNKIVIGAGNNFTAAHTRGKGAVEASGINYRPIIETAFQEKEG